MGRVGMFLEKLNKFQQGKGTMKKKEFYE